MIIGSVQGFIVDAYINPEDDHKGGLVDVCNVTDEDK